MICHTTQIGFGIGSCLSERGEVGRIFGVRHEGTDTTAGLNCSRVLLTRNSDLLLQQGALRIGEFQVERLRCSNERLVAQRQLVDSSLCECLPVLPCLELVAASRRLRTLLFQLMQGTIDRIAQLPEFGRRLNTAGRQCSGRSRCDLGRSRVLGLGGCRSTSRCLLGSPNRRERRQDVVKLVDAELAREAEPTQRPTPCSPSLLG